MNEFETEQQSSLISYLLESQNFFIKLRVQENHEQVNLKLNQHWKIKIKSFDGG